MSLESNPFDFQSLNEQIVSCRLCPRLVEWRERVGREKRKSFENESYWAKPVPLFGDPDAERLIVGLAPAAHGGNRTGRMFTGDRSGDWLYRALHKAGLANQALAASSLDGLVLSGVMIAASAHCAPPDNKPTKEELANCRPYLARVLASRSWKSILCLGSLAWNNVLATSGEPARPKFGHGSTYRLGTGTLLVGSYHPSQQNTFTGRLTEQMLDEAIRMFATA